MRKGRRRRICLVVGAGRGIGAHVAAEFASHGYVACLVRRSDQKALDESVAAIQRSGHQAFGVLLDATTGGDGKGKKDVASSVSVSVSVSALEQLVDEIERTRGDVDVCVYNLGANMGARSLERTRPQTFQRAWSLGALGAFLCARACLPRMAARGRGTFIMTSATAALRGNAGQCAHASAMFARRGLAQSLAAEYWSRGVHVSHVVVDGVVDSPDTLGKHFPELFALAKAKLEPSDAIVRPVDVAREYYHLHTQRRGAWTFETELRPWKEKAWFNASTVLAKL